MALDKAKLLVALKGIQIPNEGVSNTDVAFEKLADAIDSFLADAEIEGITSDGKSVTGKIK